MSFSASHLPGFLWLSLFMLLLPLASAVSFKRLVRSHLIKTGEMLKMLRLGFYELGHCLHCYCNAALCCCSGKCAFRLECIMDLDRTSVPFVLGCLVMVSCLPSAFSFFCQCNILDSASFGNIARLLSELFRAVYYPVLNLWGEHGGNFKSGPGPI